MGLFLGTGSVSPFPLAISSDGRYLETAQGDPWLIKGDAAWSLMNQISLADAKTYIDDRASRGFTVLLTSIIEDYYCDNTPPEETTTGHDPFSPTNNFDTRNESYWSHVDEVVSYAKDKGICFFMCPAYMGFSDDGWAAEVAAESQATLTNYGEFLGARYNSYGNIVWLGGGDRALSAAEITDVDDMVDGIDTNWTGTVFGAHTRPDDDQRTLHGSNFNWMNIYPVYTYTAGEFYNLSSSYYADTPAGPVYFQEGPYEFENLAAFSHTSQITRINLWQAVLGGATAGYIFGNHSIWCFGASPASDAYDTGFGARPTWQSQLNSVGSQGAARAGAILATVSWHLYAPDTTGTVITSALGSGNSRIGCAIASDDSSALAIVPTATSPTVDMTEFSGSNVTIDWIDPITGAITNDGTYANTGTQTPTHPGNNSEGDSDWILKMVSV